MNVAVVVPAGMVTLAETDASEVLALDKLTCAPPAGAAVLSVTVAVELLPPTIVAGLSVSEDNVGNGVIVRTADVPLFA